MSAARRGGAAWLLLGTMAGALVAARFETAVACLVTAALAGAAAGAPRPTGRWFGLVGTGAVVAWTLNLFLIPDIAHDRQRHAARFLNLGGGGVNGAFKLGVGL